MTWEIFKTRHKKHEKNARKRKWRKFQFRLPIPKPGFGRTLIQTHPGTISLSWPWQIYGGIAKSGGNPGPTGLRIASVNANVSSL